MRGTEGSRTAECVAALRDLVTSGTYARGDRLPPERELAARFGVSRPLLREAVRALTESGLLEARQGSGTYVASTDLPDLFALRMRVEPLAAELAARRRSERQSTRLAELHARLAEAVDDPTELARRDQTLHAAIAQAASSPLVEATLARIDDAIVVSRSVTKRSLAARRSAVRHLGEVVAAIAAGDPAAAGAAMERHLRTVGERASQGEQGHA